MGLRWRLKVVYRWVYLPLQLTILLLLQALRRQPWTCKFQYSYSKPQVAYNDVLDNCCENQGAARQDCLYLTMFHRILLLFVNDVITLTFSSTL